MKKFKTTLKILSAALATLMIAGIFAGCRADEKAINADGKFTYWVTMPTNASQTLETYNDLMMYNEISKRTGINVEFVHPSAGTTGTEAFQILMSSGDYPDMIEYYWATYTGGPDQAINDGVIISLNDYLEDYAPNYYDIMEGKQAKENNFKYKADSISKDGNYYGFKGLNVGTYSGYGGLFVRKDMLDKWGLSVPETIDEWTTVFKTAKENGVKAPLTGQKGIFAAFASPSFNSAWNIGKNFYVDKGTVKFGPIEDEYIDYLNQIKAWYDAGYIDIDFVTNDATNVEGFMTNGFSVASFGYVGGTLGKLIPAMLEKDPNYELAACPYPVMKKGDIPLFQEIADDASDPSIAVSVQCGLDNEDRYKAAIKWCDYIYSKDGQILKTFGIEDSTFIIQKDENGDEHYIYTDTITDHEKIGAHSVEASLWHFMRPANAPGFNQHPDYLNGFYPYDTQKEAIKVWNKYKDEADPYALPSSLAYTSKEASEKATIEAAHKNNIEAAISNYIIGKISSDEYSSEIEKAYKSGYNKLIKIQQDAYDRYIAIKG